MARICCCPGVPTTPSAGVGAVVAKPVLCTRWETAARPPTTTGDRRAPAARAAATRDVEELSMALIVYFQSFLVVKVMRTQKEETVR